MYTQIRYFIFIILSTTFVRKIIQPPTNSSVATLEPQSLFVFFTHEQPASVIFRDHYESFCSCISLGACTRISLFVTSFISCKMYGKFCWLRCSFRLVDIITLFFSAGWHYHAFLFSWVTIYIYLSFSIYPRNVVEATFLFSWVTLLRFSFQLRYHITLFFPTAILHFSFQLGDIFTLFSAGWHY